MTAIQALQDYHDKLRNAGKIIQADTVQSCIAIIKRLEKKESAHKIETAILQPGQV
jgi:hypothetical protein